MQTERFYPAPPDKVYEALLEHLKASRHKLQSSDDFSRSTLFRTPGLSLATVLNMTASVKPADGGATVELVVGQRFKGRRSGATGAEMKQSAKILDGVSARLR